MKHEKFRTLLLILSGANLGAYGSGATIALHLLGLADVFDIVVGVSTGAGVGGYYLAGEHQMLLGSSIYYTEFAGTDYINYCRLRKIIDVDLISKVMRCGRTKLDTTAIKTSRSSFFTCVTDAKTCIGELVDAKQAMPDVISAIEASSAMPLGYNSPVKVNQHYYYDGGIALPFPIREICETFRPTDVLVIPNRPFRPDSEKSGKLAERFFTALALRNLPLSLRTAITSRHKRFQDGLNFVQNCDGINIEVFWPPDMGIHQLTRKSAQLRAAVHASVKQTLSVFGQAEKKFHSL